MSAYAITLTDIEDRGVTAAREFINANPSDYDDQGNPVVYNSNAEYIQHVMSRAADSYVEAFGVS